MAWVAYLAPTRRPVRLALGQHDYGLENVFFPGKELARADVDEGAFAGTGVRANEGAVAIRATGFCWMRKLV